MFKVYNNVEDIIIFNGNERDFINFARLILKENGDENFSILGRSDAIEYIDDYCGNLEVEEI